MKKLLFVAFIAGVTLLSCSKKNNPKPAKPGLITGTVLINGTTYSTVKIGTQTWTSVNYNNGPDGVYYGGSTTNDPIYGKLYTLAEAKTAAANLPNDWHLPTEADMETLLTSVGAKGIGTDILAVDTVSNKLRSTSSDWTYTQGTNTSGFNAYPAGVEYLGLYYNRHTNTTFWTNTSYINNTQWTLSINNTTNSHNDYSEITFTSTENNTRLSVRFVKDN